MGTRDKGSGSVSLRSPGVYRLRVYVGTDPATGRGRQVSRTVKAKTITEARKRLGEFVVEMGGQVIGTEATVRTLMAEWTAQLVSDKRAPLTIAAAKNTAERVILPVLGDVRLRDLGVREIDLMNRTTAGLAASSRRRYLAVLSAALGKAVDWRWIDSNPALRVTIAPDKGEGLVVPSQAEVEALRAAMPGEVWKMAIRLATLTGARRGELCGLKWSDIDSDHIYIRRSIYRLAGENHEKTPKSGKVRRIPLLPETAKVISEWGAWCKERADSKEVTVDPSSYVLSTWPDCSRCLNPDTLSSHVRRFTKEAMPHVHLHSVRHFAATTMLTDGVPVPDVAEILGHSDGGRLLLSTYGHPTTDSQKAAAQAMARSLKPKELTS
jgi:integrase